MRPSILSTALIAIVAFPLVAGAQNAASPGLQGDLRQEMKRKEFIVLPKPSTDTVTQDAERAADELAAKQRTDELMRPSTQPPRSRPELDQSVVNGIQGQQVDRALRSLNR